MLQQWQGRAGLGYSLRTILEALSRITIANVVLPLADNSGRNQCIRCVGPPPRKQQIQTDHLGLPIMVVGTTPEDQRDFVSFTLNCLSVSRHHPYPKCSGKCESQRMNLPKILPSKYELGLRLRRCAPATSLRRSYTWSGMFFGAG